MNKTADSYWITAALKVSPAIRATLFDKQYGNIFIGNYSLPIEDRFYFKECFHCQQVGHVSTECPKSNDDPVCFYCMGSHSSKSCPKKKLKSEHCCSKCFNSHIHAEKNSYNTHNAADQECPVVIREKIKISNNTDNISKNVM